MDETRDPVHHWPGEDNIADLGTKGKATIQDIARGSRWQTGPSSLSFPRDKWLATREFKRALPVEEVVVRQDKVVFAVQHDVKLREPSGPFREGWTLPGGGLEVQESRLVGVVKNVLLYTNKLKKAERILARIVCGGGLQSKEAARSDPTESSIKVAWKLMDMVAALDITKYVGSKLLALAPVLKDGSWVTQG